MCPDCPNCRAGSARVVRNGHFFRQSDSRYIQSFRCGSCRKYFSHATFSDCYRQKKRRINDPLMDLLTRDMCLRDLAEHLKVSRTTIARRIPWLAKRARRMNSELLDEIQIQTGPFDKVQFDDLLTVEHTKCKPVTSTVAVQEGTRLILDHSVARIPASGTLAAVAREKYGHRADHSRRERHALFERLKERLPETVMFRSDQHKHYPIVIKKHFPNATHKTYKGAKPTLTGGGELKKMPWDKLFSINHTMAMLRSKMSRLNRRSWNLSKRIERLDDHMAIYSWKHNLRVWKQMQKKQLLKSAEI